ncbi:MAG TPA: acyl-homoserine-lactone synthase [Ktedonobacteraceae bacterium]
MDFLQTYEAETGALNASEQEMRYGVRTLSNNDTQRLAEYQRLRGSTFVQRLGWQIPVDSEGRDVDRYDKLDEARSFISTHCTYGIDQQEHLLGGVRILTLRDWNDSMIENEFRSCGMFPQEALLLLKRQHHYDELLELTRFCVRSKPAPYKLPIARDLTYAAVYAQSLATGRAFALGVADFLYYQVMRRSHFHFTDFYTYRLNQRGGYALVVIDLWETIRSLLAHGEEARVKRMLLLCV